MKNYKLNVFAFILIGCLIISIILINVFNKKVLPIFMEYVVSEMKNQSTIAINKAIKDGIKDVNTNMIDISKNKEAEIEMIDFNPKLVNEMLTLVTENILNNLKEIESGKNISFDKYEYSNGTIFEVPLGTISNNIFISNLGPKIPVKLNIIGDVLTNIKTEVKEYGINNALIQISISVKVEEKVIIPFISKDVDITMDIPISLKLIQGKIPEYYGGFFSKNSGILSIPAE